MLTRRRFLGTLALAVAGFFSYARWFEPGRVTVTNHVLGEPEVGLAPVRIIQVTHLHLQQIGRHEEALAEALHRLAPDILVLTGDSIDRPDSLTALGAFLDLLPTGVPGFATLSNWEHWSGVDQPQLRSLYADRGIRLLINETVTIRHDAHTLLLTGLDDATGGRPNLEEALRDTSPARNHIILAHSPGYRDVLIRQPLVPVFSPICVLSGHTHGGQVNLGGWAPLRPGGSGRYVSGWYRDIAPDLYVSRGIGTSVIPIRFGAPPEIAVFEWHLRT
jgi:uncharacterized protein